MHPLASRSLAISGAITLGFGAVLLGAAMPAAAAGGTLSGCGDLATVTSGQVTLGTSLVCAPAVWSLSANTTLDLNGNTLSITSLAPVNDQPGSAGISGGHTLTVTGSGSLMVTGGPGGIGGSAGAEGAVGGPALDGDLVVRGATVTFTAGQGGAGAQTTSGDGAAGGTAVTGDVIIIGGDATLIGGSGGAGGAGQMAPIKSTTGGSGGAGANAVTGTVMVFGGTATVRGGAGGAGGNGGAGDTTGCAFEPPLPGDGGNGGAGGNGGGAAIAYAAVGLTGDISRGPGGSGGNAGPDICSTGSATPGPAGSPGTRDDPAILTGLVLSGPSTAEKGDTIAVSVTGTDGSTDAPTGLAQYATLSSSVAADTVSGDHVTFHHASPHTITATLGVLTGTLAVEVSDPAPSALANTGGDPMPSLVGAAGLLLLGSVLLAVRRRRA